VHLLRNALHHADSRPELTPPFVVAGVGSPFGDDRLGWEVAERLRQDPWFARRASHVRIVSLDRPGPALLDVLQGAERAIVVDAMRSGAQAGSIRRIDLDRVRLPRDSLVSVHGFGLADTIELGRMLGLLPWRLTLFGIEAHSINGAGRTTAAAARAVAEVCLRVRACLCEP